MKFEKNIQVFLFERGSVAGPGVPWGAMGRDPWPTYMRPRHLHPEQREESSLDTAGLVVWRWDCQDNTANELRAPRNVKRPQQDSLFHIRTPGRVDGWVGRPGVGEEEVGFGVGTDNALGHPWRCRGPENGPVQ